MSPLYPRLPVYAAPCLRGQCRLLTTWSFRLNLQIKMELILAVGLLPSGQTSDVAACVSRLPAVFDDWTIQKPSCDGLTVTGTEKARDMDAGCPSGYITRPSGECGKLDPLWDVLSLVVVLCHSNSISVLSWRWYDVWDEEEKSCVHTFTDSRDL